MSSKLTVIMARSALSDADTDALVGKRVEQDSYPVLLKGNAALLTPQGKLAARSASQVIPADVADSARPWLRSLKKRLSDSRGAYAGVKAKPRVRMDGTLGNTSESVEVPSSVAGFMDRTGGRFPYCRSCAANNLEGWPTFIPFAQAVSAAMKAAVPDRWQKQMDEAKLCHPAYIIPETPFSTVTINNTFAGACHRDAGDYKDGFGCMAVLRRGRFRGCWLGFPRYGVAFDLQDRDLVFFDPHEVHGNTQFVDGQGVVREDWERISVVFYLRSRMRECGSPAEELARARSLGSQENE